MKSILKKLIFVGMIVVLGFTTVSSPLKTYAAGEQNSIINDSPVNMIKQTDSELIYEMETDGEVLRYEEKIKENKNKTKIETKIYKFINGKKVLVDNSKKEIINSDSQVEFITDGESVIFNKDEITTTEVKPETDISTFAYSSWVKSKVPGINLGYRRDLAKNYGDASYGTLSKKKVKLNNSYFDTFKSKVDSLKSRENSFLLEATIVGAVQHILKKGFKSWSVGDLVVLLRKLSVPINIVWQVAWWIVDYDKAIKAFNKMPGSIIHGCNWKC